MSESGTPQAAVDTAFNAGTDVVKAAADVATAQEIARATDSAALLAQIVGSLESHNADNMATIKKEMVKVVTDALGEVPSRYIDVGRIPLICKAIFSIQLQLKLVLWVLTITGGAVIVALVGKLMKIS